MITSRLEEGGRPVSSKDLLVGLLGDTVGKGEFETSLDQLLDVGALHVGGLLDLDDLENLGKV